MIYVLAVYLLTGFAGGTETLESAYAQRLMRTRRPAEIERLRGQYDRARISRLTCRWQIDRGTAPIECYEVLATERAWRVLDESRYRQKRRHLDAACARATLNLRVPEAGASLTHVSSDCAGRVRDARLTRAYRRTDHPWSED